jgi:signal transduction histidine kinase
MNLKTMTNNQPHTEQHSLEPCDGIELEDAAPSEVGLIALLSHQIRSPLYTIRNVVAEMKTDGTHCVEQCRAFVAIIDRNTDRIVALTERCLRLMELEERRRSHRNIEKETLTDLRELIERTVTSLSEEDELKAKGIRVDNWQTSDPALVRCNPFLIEQALANLLANAMQYGQCRERQERHELPTAIVRLIPRNDHYYVEVEDFGNGIPEQLQSLVFKPFYRAPSSSRLRQSGCGLGLSIAKTIIESYGGRIALESTPNVGTKLWFTLPRASAMPSMMQDYSRDHVVEHEE